MRPRMPGLLVPCLLLAASTSPAWGESEATALEDGAHLFSPDALAEAGQRLDAFRTEHERDLMVETIPSVPGSTWRWMLRMKSRKPTSFAADQIRKRQKEAGLPTGIYVLICQEPPGVFLDTWPNHDPAWFPERDQKRTGEQLTRALAEEPPDRLLQHVLGEIHRELQPPPDPPASPALLVGLLAGLLATWVVLALLAARAARADAEIAGLPPPSPDLRAAWLGSLFGLPTTGWIHDRLFQASAPPDAPPDEGDLFASGPSSGTHPTGSPGYDPETTWDG